MQVHLKRVGLQKTTLIDYPKEVASTVFTHGCNLRCPYCHNPELITGPVPDNFIDLETFYAFIEKRRNVLGGICITGGEPLLSSNLEEVIDTIHSFGLKVKLDTNGTLPERLKKISPDYIAMDLKTVPEKYSLLTGMDDENDSTKKNQSMAKNIISSLEYLKKGKIPYEIRTTWAPGIVEREDIPQMASLLKGVPAYYITSFRQGVTLLPSYNDTQTYSARAMEDIKKLFKKYGIDAHIR